MNQFNIKKRVTIDLNQISDFISMSLTEDSSTSVTMSSGSTVSTGSPDGGGNVSTSCVSFEGKTVDEGEMYYPYGHDACQVRQPWGQLRQILSTLHLSASFLSTVLLNMCIEVGKL